MPTRLVAVLLALVSVLAACGADDDVATGDDPTTTTTSGSTTSTTEDGAPPESDIEAPPPVTVRGEDGPIELRAWTYCFGNGCADGTAPENPPDVGGVAEVVAEFPLDGWEFSATFRPAGDPCGREQTVALEERDDGAFVLAPAGRAGAYDVLLFGRGQGDLATSFRWTTTVDGPLPVPEARLAVLADHDGAVDSYGVELGVDNLAATPAEVLATVTVTAADGASLTFDATPATAGCRPEGSLYFDGPDEQGLAAAGLGPRPFTYDVVLTLDGARHVAHAAWPDDQIPDNQPSVALVFDPPLPSLR